MNINECGCRPYGWLGLDGNRCIRVIPRHKQVKAFNPAINYIFLADFMAEKIDTIVHAQNSFEEIYKRKYVE